jgi:hypothetical protein
MGNCLSQIDKVVANGARCAATATLYAGLPQSRIVVQRLGQRTVLVEFSSVQQLKPESLLYAVHLFRPLK